MKRLRVYIASPIRLGDLCNNLNAATDCYHRLLRSDLAPLCPALSCYSGDSYRRMGRNADRVGALAEVYPRGTTHEDWMGVDLPWVEVSDAVLRLPGASVGADAEVAHARAHGIPVFYSEEHLLTWAEDYR